MPIRRSGPGGHIAAGAAAEEYAARALARDGHRVLLRNVRTPHGEIDIVALRRKLFRFVEVKARRMGGSAGDGAEALTPAKLKRVAAAAEHVLHRRGVPDAECELVGAVVDLDPDGSPVGVEFLVVEELR